MIRNSLLALSLFALTLPLVGCGPSGGTTYDMESAPPVTPEEIQASEDYEAQMDKEYTGE